MEYIIVKLLLQIHIMRQYFLLYLINLSFVLSRANARFDTLKEIFNIKNRIIEFNQKPNFNLLVTPLKIKRKVLKSLQAQSINFIKTILNTSNNI